MGIENSGWEAIVAAHQGNVQRAISGSRGKAQSGPAQQEKVSGIFEKFFADQGGSIQPDQLRNILKLLASTWSDSEIEELTQAEGWVNCHSVTCEEFLRWIFRPAKDDHRRSKHRAFADRKSSERGWGSIINDIYEGRSSLEDAFVRTSFETQLRDFLDRHPYLEPGSSLKPHPVQHWVERCRESFQRFKFGEAQEHLRRAISGIAADKRQTAEAFRRFDTDSSGHLDVTECRHMCAYLGWGSEEADLLDLNRDGRITLDDFQTLVGRMGGVQQLFEHRRLRISDTRKDVCDQSGLVVGARVRSHFYSQRQKSRSWREAVVLGVGVEKKSEMGPLGPVTYGVLLQFGFGLSEKTSRWKCRQVVPPTWVLSSVEDASTASALREIGLLDDDQSFWSLLLPDSEMAAVEKLEECQKKALKCVRDHSAQSHAQKLPALKEKFESLGCTARELQAVLSWIQDLAPIVVHIHIDRMGHFMEFDEYYRNQFETKTSCGALDSNNMTRTRWETELFGGAYDGCKPFERPKYGALNVMNDYRGVVRARQYGDSYMVLKDVRLRTTFASTDSGGIRGNRLAVLDKYAHVLAEYNKKELQGLIDVAMAATTPTVEPAATLQVLRGATEDPTADWISMGFPGITQRSGRYFFEVDLFAGCGSVQVGFCSPEFELLPRVKCTGGVGDDIHSWGVDGQNAAKWHGGINKAWPSIWKSSNSTGRGYPGLSEKVIVGVAVDIDARKIWFATNGDWDDKPTFDGATLPEGVALYPAISLRGQAAFIFGPVFSHGPPTGASAGGAAADFPFLQWAGGLAGTIRVDDQKLGNEEILSIYKEIQIHGECSLKRNVQRLVACSKYREISKMQRSYAIRVPGNGPLKGTYERSGAHNNMPVYKCASGAIIYADPAAGKWYMNDKEDFTSWEFFAPIVEDVEEPPRRGWDTRNEARGVVPVDAFVRGLSKIKGSPVCLQGHVIKADTRPAHYCDMCGTSGTSYRCTQGCDYDMCDTCYNQFMDSCATTDSGGLTPEDTAHLVNTLTCKALCGNDMIFRVVDGTTLEAEWEKLSSATGSADSAWTAAIKEGLQMVREEAGFGNSVVVETDHPYAANRSKWSKEVPMDGVNGIVVHFCSKSCTLDGRTRFRTFTGGLRRNSAGVGARVEVQVHGGDKVWGTVTARDPEDRWEILLDREQHTMTEDAMESSWPQVGDELEARYRTGKWHKAKVLELRSDGMYFLEWFDGLALDREKHRRELRHLGIGGGEHKNLEDLPRYALVPAEITTRCFSVCFDTPAVATVTYSKDAGADEQGFGNVVGDEILSFGLNRACPLTPIIVEKFSVPGPAQEKGVKVGWYLDLVASVGGPSSERLIQLLNGIGDVQIADGSEISQLLDAAFQNVDDLLNRLNNDLRRVSDIVLVFTNSSSPAKVILLPDAHVAYGESQQVNEEIQAFVVNDHQVRVESFSTRGPAQAAGVRTDWLLDLPGTLRLNPKLAKELPELVPPDPPKDETPADTESTKKALAAAFCPAGHELLRSRSSSGWRCDSCSTHSSSSEKGRWRCNDCDYDLCRSCYEFVIGEEVQEEDLAPVSDVEKPAELPYEIHDLSIAYDDRGRLEELLKAKMDAFLLELGVSDPAALPRMFPDVEPDIKVEDADGEEVCGPEIYEALGPEKFPVIFKIKLPKVPEKKPDGVAVAAAAARDAAGKEAATTDGVDEATKVGYVDKDGDKVEFAIEDGKLIKYVNGNKRCGKSDTSGIITSLKFSDGSPADVRDQYGWGSDDFPWEVVHKLKQMADACGVPNNLPDLGSKAAAEEAAEVAAAAAAEKVAAEKVAAEALLAGGLERLLQKTGVKLAFVQPHPTKIQRFQDSGPAGPENWLSHDLPGDFVEFEFSTDGDGAEAPGQRWGVLAVACPMDGKELRTREEADAFALKWAELTRRAAGCRGCEPQVERSGWDEARLRALCARHGWEFEWMTEDGERRRRARESWEAVKIAEVAFKPLPCDTALPD